VQRRRVAYYFPLPLLVSEPIADLNLHW
jgi:hypothetical protein